MSHARHVSSTNPERVRVMAATGKIKGGRTTVYVASPKRLVERHRRLPADLRETIAWWTRINYRLLRDEGVSRTIARSIVRTYAHMASMGMGWPQENGRAGEQIPEPDRASEESHEAAPNVTERGR